jgi:hypothetical protein
MICFCVFCDDLNSHSQKPLNAHWYKKVLLFVTVFQYMGAMKWSRTEVNAVVEGRLEPVCISWWNCCWTADHGRSQERAQYGMSRNEEEMIAWGSVLAFVAVEILQILLVLYHRQTQFQSTKFYVQTIMLSNLTQPVILAIQVYGWLWIVGRWPIYML